MLMLIRENVSKIKLFEVSNFFLCSFSFQLKLKLWFTIPMEDYIEWTAKVWVQQNGSKTQSKNIFSFYSDFVKGASIMIIYSKHEKEIFLTLFLQHNPLRIFYKHLRNCVLHYYICLNFKILVICSLEWGRTKYRDSKT